MVGNGEQWVYKDFKSGVHAEGPWFRFLDVRYSSSLCHTMEYYTMYSTMLSQPSKKEVYPAHAGGARNTASTPPNYPVRYPTYHLIESIRPFMEVPWRVLDDRSISILVLIFRVRGPHFEPETERPIKDY